MAKYLDKQGLQVLWGHITNKFTSLVGSTPVADQINSTIEGLRGANNGLAELDETGRVLASQLPSYVDDVVEESGLAAFPATGETGKIYIDLSNNKTYRWSGSTYVEISPSLALGETSSTAYRGDRGAAAYKHAVTNKGATFASGLYKITTNAEGHVTAATAVAKADITGLGIPAQDTTYENATTSTDGLMSSEDKTKLDGLNNAANATGSSNLEASKLFLVGAASQTDSSVTNTNENVYIGADNCLYSNGEKVATLNDVAAATGGYGAVRDEGALTSADSLEGLAINVISEITPVQDGSGEPSPTNVRAISGWDTVTVRRMGSNLIPYPYYRDSGYTNAGITYTVNADGSITANGTATAESYFALSLSSEPHYLPAGTYTMSAAPAGSYGGSSRLQYWFSNKSGGSSFGVTPDGRTFTLTEGALFGISVCIPKNNTVENVTFYPMLVVGETELPFESPSEPQILTASLSETAYSGTLDWSTGILTIDRAGVVFDGTETWQSSATNTSGKVRFYSTGSVPGVLAPASSSVVAEGLMCSHYKAAPSTTGGTYQCVQSCGIYTSGTLYFYDDTYATQTASEWQAYVAAQYAAGTPLTVVYPLATPTIIQLTPKQLSSITGINHVWSNSGDTNALFNLTPVNVAGSGEGVYYIEGTGSTAGTWLGAHDDIKAYYNGLMVAYKIPVAGATTTTLNINSLGAVKVVRNATTGISTSYAAKSIALLVYTVDTDGTPYWKVADKDADTQSTTGTSNKVDTKLFLAGGTTQATSKTTYSNVGVYIGTDNCLYSNGVKVANATVATSSADGLMSAADKAKLDGLGGGGDYVLPTASASTLGGVMIGSGVNIDGGTISVTAAGIDALANHTLEAGTDFNTVTTSGAYRFNNSMVNGPANVDWSQLLVIHGGGDTVTQIIGNYGDGGTLYTRSGSQTNLGAWRTVIDTNNLPQFAMPVTGGIYQGKVYDSQAGVTNGACFRGIKIADSSTEVIAGTTAIPDGEIWIIYE